MKWLFMDDMEVRHEALDAALESRGLEIEQLTVTETAGGAIEALRALDYDHVFLDHDMGIDEHEKGVTGMTVVGYITDRVAKGTWPARTTVVVHSMNPPAAARMVDCLLAAGVTTLRVPFANLISMIGQGALP